MHTAFVYTASVLLGFVLGFAVYSAARMIAIVWDRLWRTSPSTPSAREATGNWFLSDAQITASTMALVDCTFDYARARMHHASTALAIFEAFLWLGGYFGCYAGWRIWNERARRVQA